MNEKKIQIDIWSDFVCPFCYIGRKRFEEALIQLSLCEIELSSVCSKVERNYKSYELDTTKERKIIGDVVEQFAAKYSMPLGKAERVMEKTAEKVEAAGLVYNYKNTISANTFNAHRLNYYAKEFSKDEQMTARLSEAHFVDGLDINDIDVLSTLGEEVGLNKSKIVEMLNSHRYYDELENDKKMAIELNIDIVPTYIINKKHRISGVLSSEDYLEILKKVISDN